MIKLIKRLFGFKKKIEKKNDVVAEETKTHHKKHGKKKTPHKGSHEERHSSNRQKNNTPHKKQHRDHKSKPHSKEQRPELAPPVRQAVEPAKCIDTWQPATDAPEEEGKTAFASLNIANPILHAVDDLGFAHCTDIQAQALPHTLKGIDLIGKAQTGTGKTAAFLISVFDHFLQNPLEEQMSGTPRALILAPTRELVQQICNDAQQIGPYTDAVVEAVYGGIDYEKQAAKMNKRVDLLVATPGRLIDFQRKGYIDLKKVEILVLDEADRMLDMGFIPDVRRIVAHMPATEKRKTLLFSATLNDAVMRLAQTWLKKDAVTIEITPENVVNKEVDQVIYMVQGVEKLPIILWYLKHEKVERMIIFANQKRDSFRLHRDLYCHGIDSELLTGDVPQKKRQSILERFRTAETKVIVATDVAGRGIHVDNVSHVVNFELPYEPEDYVHRVGRTGRAGVEGRAISFACESSGFELPAIEEYIGSELKCKMPPEEMLVVPETVRSGKELRDPGASSGDKRRSGGGQHRSGGGGRRPHNSGKKRY